MSSAHDLLSPTPRTSSYHKKVLLFCGIAAGFTHPKARAPAPREPAIPSSNNLTHFAEKPTQAQAWLSTTTLVPDSNERETDCQTESPKKNTFFSEGYPESAVFRSKIAGVGFFRPPGGHAPPTVDMRPRPLFIAVRGLPAGRQGNLRRSGSRPRPGGSDICPPSTVPIGPP